MMKRLHKPLLLLVAAVALAGAGLIESFNLLAARHRDQVIQELQKVLGHDVSFGSLEVNLWGRPGFVATEFRIADDSRFAATPAVRARELVLGVSLWNLLQRRLVITSMTFNEPQFQIITEESGAINLSELLHRKAELRQFPRLRPATPDRRPVQVSFSIDEVAINRGRIDYIDRSVRQPAELRVRNVSLKLTGFQPKESTRIRIGASLTEGLGQDVRIKGEIARAPDNRSWLQRDVDLSVEMDSLHVPVVARAIAAMRDKIPGELDVTGPMALRMTARGTIERPRLEDITLRIPLFGSTEYNAVVTGAVRFGEPRTWEGAELDGTMTIDPLSLNRIRSFPVLQKLLPADLISEGSVKVSSRFEGTWEHLRIGALVLAGRADLRYRDWLRKPAETPAVIRARISREKQRLVFHPSELAVGERKLHFTGSMESQPAPALHVRFYGKNAPLVDWGHFLSAPGVQVTAGRADFDVLASKRLSAAESSWSLRGALKLDNAALKNLSSGRSFDHVQAQIAFEGTKARFHNASLRSGRSVVVFDGSAADLSAPRLQARFRADELHLADLPGLGGHTPARLRNTSGRAELGFDGGDWLLAGSVTAAEGNINNWPLRDLRADIEWATEGLTFKNLQAQALQGVLRADGFLPGPGGQTRPLLLSLQIDGAEMRALLAHWFPPLRDRFEGRLFGKARWEAGGADAVSAKEALSGSGAAHIENGTIRNFNLASQLLMKGSDSAALPEPLSRMPAGFAALLHRRDTAFDSIRAEFKIEKNRLSSDNLVITTPDYTITGAGWVGTDRSTRWNGMLVLSPRLTQEVQREYRSIRYLLDRRGRLSVGFRIDGKVPDLSIRLENRALAQALGFSPATKGSESGDGGKEGKNWIPDALERYLKR